LAGLSVSRPTVDGAFRGAPRCAREAGASGGRLGVVLARDGHLTGDRCVELHGFRVSRGAANTDRFRLS
jgi:hypothetical protein